MSSPFDRYGAVLTIDLAALSTNFRTLAAQAASGGAQVAAVVKADAYGLGIAQVAPTLAAAGCTRFFVAMPEEGLTLRGLLPDVEIFVLSGPLGNGAEVEDCAALAAANLMPILNSPGQISRWRALQDQLGRTAAAGLHVDTGMNRLGLAHTDLIRLEERGQLGAGLDLRLIMSHLACADEAAHPLNQAQLGRFQGARALLPEIPASLAASFGTFLGNDFLFDWVRPGAALYGINPRPKDSQPDQGMGKHGNPMAQVVTLQAKILQIRDVDSPHAVGYGATHRVTRKARIATIAAGYADGLFRTLGNRGCAILGGERVPIVGRVSMDLITLDVTGLPERVAHEGALVDLLGPGQDVDSLATQAGTIGYEILTALGRRYARSYVGAEGIGKEMSA